MGLKMISGKYTMNLKEAFDKHGTDKSTKHQYHLIYESLFKPKQNQNINFLEIGIWKGHGMAAMLDYFPNANVYGIDIFTRITPEQVPVLKNSRTHWIKGDTLNPSITGVVAQQFNTQFDFILDDGAHYPDANKLTFRHLHQFLKPGGLYIIEDVWPLDKMIPEELMHPWLRQHLDKYNFLKNEAFLYELRESGMKISTYDNRMISKQPDSYVIVLEKTQ